ncbi:MAG: hypothetical protein M1319_02495 [Chloroflexi bacterium]|nr:hypothetical protein [Chloroflexota bacterium]
MPRPERPYTRVLKTTLVCGQCGKAVDRLLSPPMPPEKSRFARVAALLCEECLADLEEEYTQEQNYKDAVDL